MKASLLLATLWIGSLAAPVALATPEIAISTDEILFGENDATYSVIRNIYNNTGNYYRSQTETRLIERSRITNEVIRDVLLVDAISSVDPNHNDPATPPPIERTVRSSDQSIVLGELLAKAPLAQGVRLKPDQLASFEISMHGLRYGPRLSIHHGPPLTSHIPKQDLPETTWEILEGREAADVIYLRIRMEPKGWEDGNDTTGWLCINPDLTTQIRAYRTLESICLSAGVFTTEAEAISQATAWRETCKHAKATAYDPQVWARDNGTNQPDYLVVVSPRSRELLAGRSDVAIEKALGQPLKAISSHRFTRWFRVPHQ